MNLDWLRAEFCTTIGWIKTVLSNADIWPVLSAMSSAVASFAALKTVYHSRILWENQRESERAYFVLEKPGIKELPNSPPYRIQLTMMNTGNNVASNLFTRLIVLKEDLTTQPSWDFSTSHGNDIPPNSPTPWYFEDIDLKENTPGQHIVLAIKYEDPILKKNYKQIFFMKWHGVVGNSFSPDFVYAKKEEVEKISEYLQEILHEYLI